MRARQWARATTVDVRVQRVPGEKVPRRGRVQVYVGSGEHGAGLRMLDPESEFARLRFTEPLTLAPGDRIVIRDPGRVAHGGGSRGARRRSAGVALADAVDYLSLPLGARLVHAHRWLAIADVPRVARLPTTGRRLRRRARGLGRRRTSRGLAGRSGDSSRDCSAKHGNVSRNTTGTCQRTRGSSSRRLASALREDPARLRAALEDTPGLVVERGVVREAAHVTSAAESPEARALVAALDASPFSPPSPADVGAPVALVRALVRDGVLVDLDGVIFTAAALDAARQRVIDVLAEHGTITVAGVRDALGSSRKYVVPIVGGSTARASLAAAATTASRPDVRPRPELTGVF